MKKFIVLIAIVLGTANLNAQDYDLQGLAKTLNHYCSNDIGMWREPIRNFHEGLAVITINVRGDIKCGYIDKCGRFTIPAKYEEAQDFSEGLAFVQLNGKWGVIDKTGRTVIPFEYEDARNSFHEGLAVIKKNGKYGVIDKSGKVVVPFIWEHLDDFSEGLSFAYRINNGKGEGCFINDSGDIVIPFGLNKSSHGFSEGIAAVTTVGYYDENGNYKSGKDVFIDKSGKVLFQNNCSSQGFREGLSKYQQGKKYGFVNKNGQFAISPIYDYVGDFHEGVAWVKKDGKAGAIDKSGKIVVPIIYDEVGDCSDGLLVVTNNDVFDYDEGIVDKAGNVVIPIGKSYSISTMGFSEGLVKAVNDSGRYGYIDKQGNTTFCPPASDNTTSVSE